MPFANSGLRHRHEGRGLLHPEAPRLGAAPRKRRQGDRAPLPPQPRQFLDEWLNASGLSAEPTAPLFPTLRHGKLTGRAPLPQANVHMMIQRRALAAGIATKISCHSFRATGITTYLQNGGKLEVAQQMAGHESARTTGLYDRRNA